jgi:hypothetical protein
VPAAKKSDNNKVEVVLSDSKPMKGVVKFTTDDRPVAITNIYLSRESLQKLGNPDAVKVTIEPHDPEA